MVSALALRKVVYEKPFGTSLESFRLLDGIARDTFEESQIYRIDHFPGKEAATQNIHVLAVRQRPLCGSLG